MVVMHSYSVAVDSSNTMTAPLNASDRNQQPPLADDLIVGAEAIAKELGLTPRQVFYFAAKGELPIRKLGRLLTASRSRLRRHFAGEQQ
jgi:hypothetical protein